MGQLIAATLAVRMDEPCFGLSEVNLQAPGSRGWRRFQVLQVVRGDRLAECRLDLGPAKGFKVEQFRIPGGVVDETTGRAEILHTVGELRDIAEYLRSGRGYRPEVQPSNLIQGYHDEMEKRRLRARGRGLSLVKPH